MTTSALVLRREDRIACRGFIRHHSKSFFLSSLLLPPRVRYAAWALYAFCRRADDAVDELEAARATPPQVDDDALFRIERLRQRLDRVYRGGAEDDAIDRAFAGVVADYGVPRQLPEALLLGMEMDARGVTYQTDHDLLVYCFRVASTVGLMMTCVMGRSADVAFLRAADLGVAMQLTNIARDVGEDARRGRVYLPDQLLASVGLARAAVLSMRSATPALARAVQKLLARADAHYRAADTGIPLLPRDCRFAIAASRQIYSAIGRAIGNNHYDSVSQRAYVTLPGKLALLLRALPMRFGKSRTDTPPGPADAELRPLLRDVGLPG